MIMAKTIYDESRRVSAGVNKPKQISLTLIDGRTINVSSNHVKEWYLNFTTSYPSLRNINQDIVVAFAVEQTKLPFGTYLSPGQMAITAERYGLNSSDFLRRLQGGTGSGGGGVNKADTVRTISALVSDMAKQLGIAFTPEQVATLSTTAEKQNWSRDQIVDELTKNVEWYKLNSGTIKTSYESYKTFGKQYLVNVSDTSAQNWALQIAKGETTEETVLQSIREAAKAANPWLASYIDQGLNPIDVLAPNRDFIAQNLEISPLELDLMDQKTLNLMTTTDASGVRKLADQSQMVKQVRTDERWKNTGNAKDLTAGMASILARVFGRSVY